MRLQQQPREQQQLWRQQQCTSRPQARLLCPALTQPRWQQKQMGQGHQLLLLLVMRVLNSRLRREQVAARTAQSMHQQQRMLHAMLLTLVHLLLAQPLAGRLAPVQLKPLLLGLRLRRHPMQLRREQCCPLQHHKGVTTHNRMLLQPLQPHTHHQQKMQQHQRQQPQQHQATRQ